MTYNPGMRRRAAGALIATGFLLLILSPVGAVATPLPDRSEPWIKVRTAHFTLFSNASEQYTVEIGMDLERFREALARLVSGLELSFWSAGNVRGLWYQNAACMIETAAHPHQ